MPIDYLLVVSEEDPVARRVAEQWGTGPASEWRIEGTPVRTLGPHALVVRRPGWHIHDEHFDRLLPDDLRARAPVLVFPSIHRSERGVPALTVHPLGNVGPANEVGGEPRRLVPTSPRLMAATLRALAEGAGSIGTPVTFEATHHGPALDLPAFFAEIGYGELAEPPADAVRLLAATLADLAETDGDRIALGVGGGHYAPHFTELVLKRRWAIGHMLSRHALSLTDRSIAEAAYAATPAAEGIVFARAEDASAPIWAGIGPRLKDTSAPPRERAAPGP